MCGRYSTARGREEIIDAFDVERDTTDALEPDYNVAPTKPVPMILTRDVRELHVARWGLVPSWAKDPAIGSRMINARVETVHEKPAFRRAFARRRCLLPADGYYEWYTREEGGKQPFFIRPSDGSMLAMAGLYEVWRPAREVGRGRPGGRSGSAGRSVGVGWSGWTGRDGLVGADTDAPEEEWLLSCTVITTEASDDVGRIHERMPMLVEPERFGAWLDPELTAPEEVRSLLVPAAAGRLEAYPVSTAVNKVRNYGPELVKPLPDLGISPGETPTLF
ncbi:SOS response-associated peptidase [Actinoallomurus liliacearum]|uniref:Abasic site processing protein n=2 Tax=Actinoallomurus liliacearum TaxID=1080073 RepID=A0ABP8TNR6_9ACTN